MAKKLNNMDKLIDDMGNDNFIKKNRISQSDYADISECISKLQKGRVATTICKNVERVFGKYGFNVYSEEIGWRVEDNYNNG